MTTKPAKSEQPSAGREGDKRASARAANPPQAARQPHNAPDKARDKHHIDSLRGRGPTTKQGAAPRRGGQRGR